MNTPYQIDWVQFAEVVLSSWGYEYPHMPGVRADTGRTARGGAEPISRYFVIPSHVRSADGPTT